MAEAVDPAKGEIGTPTVIVSHLDVKYAVYGGGRHGNPSGQGEPTSFLDRLRGRRESKVREVHAVKDVSFIAHHGESIGIIGRNGSGKSTLLRAVAGLIPPSSGRLWVSGEPSLLGVNAVLKRKLSGERNIYIGAQALGLSKAEIAERFDEIVEFSGIGDAVYLPMSTYSSGMGARLRFAISTAASPDVLMIDEALATGDADFREKSAARIREIRDRAGTVFFVSHSNSNIRQICDRVLWMDRGEVLMDGPTEEVLQAYEATLPKRAGSKKTTPADEPEVPGTTRWTGDNRFQIATQVSQHTWEPGVSGCFIVSVHRLAAARAVAPVAARFGWPLLWVRPGGVPATTRDELKRLQPQRVIAIGGDELITPETYGQLEEMAGSTLERLGNDDGAVTSGAILRAFPPEDRTIVHVTHSESPGRTIFSLVAAASGRSIAVCDADSAPDELVTPLADLGPTVLRFHGTEEEWSADVVDELRSRTGATVEFAGRGGPMALAAGMWEDAEPGGRVIVAGWAAVELLTSSVAAVHTGSPLLFFSSDRVPNAVQKVLRRLQPREIVLSGTMDALPPEVRRPLGGFVVSDADQAPSAPR